MSKYIGTFVIPGCHPQDVIVSRRGVVMVDSFARRRGPHHRLAETVKQTLRWWRVQRLGSRA